ncbi:ATP-dependent DNA helicase RecQ [Synechococcus sp. ROS8604]|uniref:RecQ family ATP-dependent DNA helicase n=1 Tax=Synechococcus sp. ROS8604 TaxID=1442557 RepID=UPI0016462B20|nr:ATP-dependent DNA helicase RecQ [Synechococcus sp. ROS8604]QNI87439.1 ATP-dependent DNA helicase [Synechococcus sp. ROS8604]
MDPLLEALHRYYGWDSFRSGQRPVIEALLSGRDCLAVLPTGGGKSLCFQLPALVRQGLVVVISPLVALMDDQVLQLQRRGIAAACLHRGIQPEQRRLIQTQLSAGSLRLLYLAPERLQGEAARDMLSAHAREGRLVALAVDEAHCISAWGHDFRPDYRRLGQLRALCPGVPLVALSATAAPRVRADILRLLGLCKPLIQVSSAQRSNLHYTMRRRPSDPLPDVLEALKHSRGATLIYARTRRSVELWAERLQSQGIQAITYHAGLEVERREEALKHFLEADAPVLVATVAFGMGVDRSDVGLVLHLDLPATPEGYLQESGRAGRDGRPAHCLVLFSPGDRTSLGWAMQSTLRRAAESKAKASDDDVWRVEFSQQQLRRMEAVAEGEICREQALLLSVGELTSPCGRCDRCLADGRAKDWSDRAQELLEVIDAGQGVDIRSLTERLREIDGSEESWGWLARRLVQEELIRESNDGAQRLSLRDSGRQFLHAPWPLHYAA